MIDHRIWLRAGLALCLALPGLAHAFQGGQAGTATGGANPGQALELARDTERLCTVLKSMAADHPRDTVEQGSGTPAGLLAQLEKNACATPDPKRSARAAINDVVSALDAAAGYHPATYVTVVRTPRLLDTLRGLEASHRFRFFASPAALAHGRALARSLLDIFLAIEQPGEDGLFDAKLDYDDVVDDLEAFLSSTLPDDIHPYGRVGRLANKVHAIYSNDATQNLLTGRQLNDRAMDFLFETSYWNAQQQILLYAAGIYASEPGPLLRHVQRYRTTFCAAADASRSHCLAMLSQEMALHAASMDGAALRRSREQLAASAAAAADLNQELAALKKGLPAGQFDELRYQYPHAGVLVPDIQRLLDANSIVGTMAHMEDLAARSYYITKAAGESLVPLLQPLLFDADREVDEEHLAGMIFALGGAYGRAKQVDDGAHAHTLALALANILSLLKDEALAMGEQDAYYQIIIASELIRGVAELDAGNLKAAEQALRTIRTKVPASWFAQIRAESGFPLAAACDPEQAERFSPGPRGEERAENLQIFREVDLLELAIAEKKGRGVSIALLERLTESIAADLLSATNVKAAPVDVAIADLLDIHGKYVTLQAANRERVRAAARGLTCFLARADMRDQLGLEFISADEQRRALLGKSIESLLDNDGKLSSRRFDTTEEDFLLLQAVAILQADRGISASTARSVFDNVEQRNAVKRLDASMADRGNRATHFITQMTSQKSDVSNVTQVMADDPVGFARYARLRNQTIASLAKVRQALRDDEAALLFSQFEQKLVITAIKRDRTESHVVALPRTAIRTRIAALRAGLDLRGVPGSPFPPPYPVKDAWELYRQLLQGLEPFLTGAKVVYLVPGEDFAGFPFGAFVTAMPPAVAADDFDAYRNIAWLIDRHALAVLPSVQALTRMQDGQRPARGALLGIGQPVVAPAVTTRFALDAMPNTSRLLDKVRWKDDPVPLLNQDANSAGIVVRMRAAGTHPPHTILINSHALPPGQLKQEGIQEAAILLAPLPDERSTGVEFLTPSKVIHLDIPVRLALLLACDTGSGATTANVQQFSGLVQAFLFSGAESVIASVMPVSNMSTEVFATNLLQHIRDEQLPISTASQQAAIGLRCPDRASACSAGERHVWAHPAYWSLFTLVGSGR